MFHNILFIFIFIQSTIVLPILFIILKPLEYVFNIKFNWELNAFIIIYYLCGIEQKIIIREELIERGYILANHRCFFDFALDPYVCNASIVGRREAFWAVSFAYLLGLLDNKFIVFNRGKTTRHELFQQILNMMKRNNIKRVVFYPEGSRRTYKLLTDVDDVRDKLKLGLLKSIYENRENPIQLCITSNKELVCNEKTLTVNYNTKIKTCYSKHIHPKDHDTFELFIENISEEWLECWKLTHL